MRGFVVRGSWALNIRKFIPRLRTLEALVDSGSMPTAGRVHRWFADAAFLDVITAADVDCIVWLTPYKLVTAEGAGRIHLPTMTLIDVDLLREADALTYDAARMKSTER